MTLKLCIVCALSLNVALATIAWRQFENRRSPQENAFAVGSPPVPEIAPPAVALAPATNLVEGAFHWSQVESDDYVTYVANLRGIGCPEETLREILTADVNEFYDRKVKEMVDPISARFWDLMLHKEEFSKIVEEKVEELRTIRTERDQLLETLLGPAPAKSGDDANAVETVKRFDFLSREKIDGVQAIEAEFRRETQELFDRNASGAISASTRDQLNGEATARKLEKLKALLTPEELAEYQLRFNPKAVAVRNELADVNVTEQEVRRIAEIRMQTNGGDLFVREMLGEDRYAAYQRARDQTYRQTLAVMDRFDLPSETAAQLYEMQKAAQQEAKSIRSDSSRTEEERRALLTAIQEETERSFSTMLDPKVYRAYRRNAGDWIQNLGSQ